MLLMVESALSGLSGAVVRKMNQARANPEEN